MARTIPAAILALVLGQAAPTLAQDASTPADAQSRAIVATADAFLATLDEAGREAVLFDWEDDAQRANWSNFPTGIYERVGLHWGDMSGPQREALTSLLGTVLSEEGLRMVQQQMLADEVLRAEEGGDAGGGDDGLLDRLGGLLGGGRDQATSSSERTSTSYPSSAHHPRRHPGLSSLVGTTWGSTPPW